MTDQGNQKELLEALSNITNELKRINQTLAGLGGQAQTSRPPAPGARGPISRGPSPRGPKPAYGRPRKEGYGAAESSDEERGAAPRFESKRPSIRTGVKGRPSKGPTSFKKKEGYPKRPK
ncbi:hypothetical protein [Vampirovibrio sp.]|uniref:hypothetical protein n=1 Tax=Vampirovibrio sp. TaxID=2717857 RepID=UPI00359393E4